MKSNVLVSPCFLLIVLTMLTGQLIGCGGGDNWNSPPVLQSSTSWVRVLGGDEEDHGRSIQQTSDGGYIIAGYTRSYGSGGMDAWLIRLDKFGNQHWKRTFGGTSDDYAYSVRQTPDEGFVLTGNSAQNAFVIKTNLIGKQVWEKTFPAHEGRDVQLTSDGGYVITGTARADADTKDDVWILKLDDSGNTLFNSTIGGSDFDTSYSISQTTDSGFIVAGETRPSDSDDSRILLLKLNASGEEIWTKTFNPSNRSDIAYSVLQTNDEGYIVAGTTSTVTSFSSLIKLVYAMKLDSSGNQIWTKTFSVPGGTNFSAIKRTSDGGYVVGTTSYSPSSDGYTDFWVIKLDSSGNKIWDSHPSNSSLSFDFAYGIQQTNDSGFIIVGDTYEPNPGDKSDLFIFKVDSYGKCPDCR